MTEDQEQQKQAQAKYLQRLRLAARRLEENEDYKMLKAHLFKVAPPLQDAFTAADGYNTHAAARRDGASQITKIMDDLAQPDPEPKKARPSKAKGEFQGDQQ